MLFAPRLESRNGALLRFLHKTNLQWVLSSHTLALDLLHQRRSLVQCTFFLLFRLFQIERQFFQSTEILFVFLIAGFHTELYLV